MGASAVVHWLGIEPETLGSKPEALTSGPHLPPIVDINNEFYNKQCVCYSIAICNKVQILPLI